jgi:hypothetical protein
MSDTAHRLLVDLDALLDTRFGTILGLNKDAAAPIVESGYHSRMLDDFETPSKGLITNEAFRDAYAKRDIETLKRSIMTGIPTILRTHVDNLEERRLRQVDVESISVTINTWPYILPGPLLQQYKTVFGLTLPEHVGIGITRIDPKDLPPIRLREEYDGWCTYDLDAWMKLHYQDLLRVRCNQVTVIAPRIHIRDPGELKPDEEQEGFNPLDVHALHSMVMEEFIHIEYLPIVDFSFFHPGAYASPPYPENSSSSSSESSSA